MRVPPLLAYTLSDLDVIHLLFNSVPNFPGSYSDSLPLTNLTTASLFLYTLGGIAKIWKLSGSHNFMTHIC